MCRVLADAMREEAAEPKRERGMDELQLVATGGLDDWTGMTVGFFAFQ